MYQGNLGLRVALLPLLHSGPVMSNWAHQFSGRTLFYTYRCMAPVKQSVLHGGREDQLLLNKPCRVCVRDADPRPVAHSWFVAECLRRRVAPADGKTPPGAAPQASHA